MGLGLVETCCLVTLLSDLFHCCRAMAQAGSRDRFVMHLLSAAADKPPLRGPSTNNSAPPLPEPLSFWVAGMLPLDAAKQLRLLEMTSSSERLLYIQNLLQRHHVQGCSVQ